jgi:hypothetical protein
MKLGAPGLVLCFAMASCGSGTPFNGKTVEEGPADFAPGTVYLTQDNESLTANSISYDADKDELTINNIPFDDPNNTYIRIQNTNFQNSGFGAYQSDPEPGSNEFRYFAVFRRSDSGLSQAAATTSNEYVDFGFGGAGATRVSGATSVPTTGIYSYSGEYAAVRVVRSVDDDAATVDALYYVTGGMEMTADFGDFDEVGAVGGVVRNRILYDSAGQVLGALDGIISFANSEIDRTDGTIASGLAVEVQGGTQVPNGSYQGGTAGASGNWSGVFAGPGAEEIAGIVFVESGTVREVGGMVVNCTSAACID